MAYYAESIPVCRVTGIGCEFGGFIRYRLPMADAIILATARAYDAVIWTQDADFKDLKNVKFFAKEEK